MDIVSLGEVLIDVFPNEVGRRLTEVTSFQPKPGGAPANVALAAAKLGASAAFIGKYRLSYRPLAGQESHARQSAKLYRNVNSRQRQTNNFAQDIPIKKAGSARFSLAGFRLAD